MPGLLRGMARTAVIAGTATAVSNNVSRRQGEHWARKQADEQAAYQQQYGQQQYAQPQYAAAPAEQPQYAAAPAPAAAAPAAAAAGGADDMSATIAALKQLGDLHASGVLTDEEFAAQKAKLLGS